MTMGVHLRAINSSRRRAGKSGPSPSSARRGLIAGAAEHGCAIVSGAVRQMAMHEIDRHAAFSDGGGDALHRIVPDVSGRERARDGVLHTIGLTLKRPDLLPSAVLQEVSAGDKEARGIADDRGILRPFRVRNSPYGDEQA